MSEYEGQHPGCSGEFSELCALSLTGSLTSAERLRLETHLLHCGQCRELVSQYQDLVAHGLPLIAADVFSPRSAPVHPSWDLEAAKASLFSKLAPQLATSNRSELRITPENEARFFRFPEILDRTRYLATVAAMIFALLLAYQFGLRSGKLQPASRSATLVADSSFKRQLDTLEAQKAELQRDLTRNQQVVDQLESRAASAEQQVKNLEAARADLEHQTRVLTIEAQQQMSSVADLTAQRESLQQRIRENETELATARQELSSSEEERRQALLRNSEISDLQAQIVSLSAELADSKAAAERQSQYLASDRDVRELMGARQLYIADVFDVDSRGVTRKPFGRVFYTRGKSLIFYAFDLDKQPGYQEAKAFQAWGRPGESRSAPISLGIFYMDSESNRRWALKFENPKVLEEISSVFVTLEPKGGSKRPTNKPLLLAYLHTAPPNHP